MFEPFHQLPGARVATGGMGLGLALIAHVVQIYRGYVTFEAVPRGACLRVELPRLRERDP